ncbi:probable serine/threonine-protein kinase roco5 [Coccinella septempunctata]|uniref:probable serine/threonine-protein kinase roco5 n=1 Tax=Coccinella septempunctata TaxID=41139 RepID=UPI001D086427|nr:probable serine/threonine-protein kinase roco5 [Coccinella septempunctata]
MFTHWTIFVCIVVPSLAIPDSARKDLRILSYSGPLDEEIVKSKFSEVNSLEIRLSNITSFSKDVLRKFKKMESLAIHFSNIQNEDGVFENCCPKLTSLEIRNWTDFMPQDLKGIGTVPLKTLEILDQDIPVLTYDMFENTELKELKLIRDNIQTIHPLAFKNLIKLQYLLLSGNKLKKFPKEALSSLRNLTTLELVSNGLESLDSDDLPELPSLKKIIITNEKLKELNFTGVEKKAPSLVDIYLIGNVGVDVYGTSDRHIIHNLV